MNMLLQGYRAWCMYTMVDTRDRKWPGACTVCAAACAAACAAMERARGRVEWESSGAPWLDAVARSGKSESEVVAISRRDCLCFFDGATAQATGSAAGSAR